MSMFEELFAASDGLLAEVFGVPVMLERSGMAATSPVTAEVVMRDYVLFDDETGQQVVVQSRDYLIAASAYQVRGKQVEPREGDVIREEIGGQTYRFRVMQLAGRPAFEWADTQGTRWLLRTKKVS